MILFGHFKADENESKLLHQSEFTLNWMYSIENERKINKSQKAVIVVDDYVLECI